MQTVPTYSVRILIAGDINIIKQTCRKYCYDVGMCVTVTPTTYIYTGGEEEGVIIEFINYARFPVDDLKKIWEHAEILGYRVMTDACQHGYTIQDHVNSMWYSRRES